MRHSLFTVYGAAARGDDVVVDIELQDFFFLDGPQVEVSALIQDMLKRFLAIMMPMVLLPAPGMPMSVRFDFMNLSYPLS